MKAGRVASSNCVRVREQKVRYWLNFCTNLGQKSLPAVSTTAAVGPMPLFCCSIRFGTNATRRHSQYLAFQTKSIQATTTHDTCGAACELGSGSFDGWMMKSEEKRELCRIAAISPFTLTASSFYTAQKNISTTDDFSNEKKKQNNHLLE